MKINIFQKIAFLVYISIIVLICVYFVPYQNNDNYTFHSSIISDGYGSLSYFRFLIYIIVPTLSFYLVYKYLDGMNSVESSVYKKKAKRELYVFFLFIAVILITILFLYGKNEYSEIRKDTLKSEISKIETQLNKVEEESQSRPPLDLSGVDEILNGNPKKSHENIPPLPKGFKLIKKDTVKQKLDEFGILIRKPAFNPDAPYDVVVEKKGKHLLNKKDHTLLVNLLTKYAEEGATDDDMIKFRNIFVNEIIDKKEKANTELIQMIKDMVNEGEPERNIIILINSYDGLVKKENLELKLKNILFYNGEEIKDDIVFMFLASFILLFIIRPIFSMFKGMLREVR